MDQVIVQKATLADIPILLGFEQGVIETERPFDSTLKKENIRYYNLEEIITDSHIEIAVAELNKIIIASGYARIETSKPYLQHEKHVYFGFMYVDTRHRGEGINKKTVEFLQLWAQSQKIAELSLEVYVGNLSAIKAYQKIGFTEHIPQMRKNI